MWWNMLLKSEIISFSYDFSISILPEIFESLVFSYKCAEIQFGAFLL